MKNKRKGFTLIELIVVMALLAIVALGVGIFFKPIVKTYADANINAEFQNISEAVASEFSERFRYQEEKLFLSEVKVKNMTNLYAYESDRYETYKIYEGMVNSEGIVEETSEPFADLVAGVKYVSLKYRYDVQNSILHVRLYLAENLVRAYFNRFEYDFSVYLINKPEVSLACIISPCPTSKEFTYLGFE